MVKSGAKAEVDAGGGGLKSSSLVVCGSLVSRLFSLSKLMIAMLCSGEQALLEVPQCLEGMEGRSVSEEADWAAGLARATAVC